jgi:hypothetical protein
MGKTDFPAGPNGPHEISSCMTHLLSDRDIAELTGAVQPAAQARVLREMGLRPLIRRDGRPRVTWAAVTSAILRGDGGRTSPNFRVMNERRSRG